MEKNHIWKKLQALEEGVIKEDAFSRKQEIVGEIEKVSLFEKSLRGKSRECCGCN